VVDLIGQTTLPMMAAILARTQALLCNDSGPMHLAAAVGRPAVALFGPTDPARTGPWGTQHQVIATRVTCAPCLKRQCPLPRQLCLDDVATPAGVAAAVTRALAWSAANP
jgi:ADP-heptose:LPS heptosyltransferase